jgi:hypothetical protein
MKAIIFSLLYFTTSASAYEMCDPDNFCMTQEELEADYLPEEMQKELDEIIIIFNTQIWIRDEDYPIQLGDW